MLGCTVVKIPLKSLSTGLTLSSFSLISDQCLVVHGTTGKVQEYQEYLGEPFFGGWPKEGLPIELFAHKPIK